MTSLYDGQEIAFLTRHGKERVVRAELEGPLGCIIRHEDGYDTDQLGTFARDIPRAGTQLEAARRKANIAADMAGLPFGLASEGAFGPDPSGLFTQNVELLVLVDRARHLEIVGRAWGAARCGQTSVRDWQTLQRFAEQFGFPEHHLLLRPSSADDPRLIKGIGSWATLQSAFASVQPMASDGVVFVESDLRAFANPTRMQVIGAAARDLVRLIQSPCPHCHLPGFAKAQGVAGLPCSECGTPTRRDRGERWQCSHCGHQTERHVDPAERADPRYCDYCNP